MIPRYRPQIPTFWIPPRAEEETLAIEHEFAARFGYREAVLFPYGRVAIRAWLETLESSSREVVVGAFNCLALGNAIVSAGWSPVYVDAELDGFNHNPEEFAEALRTAGAGIAVSEWGIPSMKVETERPVLFDYALRGLGAAAAPLRPADVAMVSLGWGKPLGTLRGALLFANDSETSARLRTWRKARIGSGSFSRDARDLLLLGLALSPPVFGLTIRAARTFPALGGRLSGRESTRSPADWDRQPSGIALRGSREQLRRLDELRRERQSQQQIYYEGLASLKEKGIHVPLGLSEAVYLSHYPLRIEDGRDRVEKALLEGGIFTSSRLFDRLLPDYDGLGGLRTRNFPNARMLTAQTLHLPLYFGLPSEIQRRVIETIRRRVA